MSLLGLDSADWAQVGSALFTAVAAGASWASVRQTRKDRRARETPDIFMTVLTALETNAVSVHFVNRGGFATDVYFMVRSGRNVLTGHLPPTASLGPSQELTLRTSMPGTHEGAYEGLVTWRDHSRRTLHTRSMKGNYRAYSVAHRWSRGRRFSNRTIFEKDYADGDLIAAGNALFGYEPVQ